MIILLIIIAVCHILLSYILIKDNRFIGLLFLMMLTGVAAITILVNDDYKNQVKELEKGCPVYELIETPTYKKVP